MSNESALALIDSISDDRVLFVGDEIIDEYHYCTPLQRAAKEFLIPLQFNRNETFSGGVDAAAAHLRSFCEVVHISSEAEAVRKVRFVDENTLQKLAEVHYADGRTHRPRPDISNYDCVVAADFGHGEIYDPAEFDKAKWLAVSAQTNSANRGFNLITKYSRADYIVIDEPEARLAAGWQGGSIEDVIEKLAQGRCQRFVITRGRYGACGYDNGEIFWQHSFTGLVVDTMGAGDAFFAITAPMSRTGSMKDLLRIGCAAGALKCMIPGHRSSVTKEKLIDFIRAN